MPRDPSKITERGLKYRAQRAAFYQANRERKLAEMRDYRARNRDLLVEKQKAYQRRRFFYARHANLKLRHPEQEVASPLELAQLWHGQKGICPFTGIRLNRYNCQLDHITPLVNGGTGTINNLRWVERNVNYAKRDLPEDKFIEMCRLVTHRKEST